MKNKVFPINEAKTTGLTANDHRVKIKELLLNNKPDGYAMVQKQTFEKI